MIPSFNYELLEYLGDSFLNFVIAKRFFFDTAIFTPDNGGWANFPAEKLNDLKVWFSSNHFIAFVLYEQFFKTFPDEDQKKYAEIKMTDKTTLNRNALKFPLLYDDTHLKYYNQVIGYNGILFRNCVN